MASKTKRFTYPGVACIALTLACGGSQHAAEPADGTLTSPNWSEADSEAEAAALVDRPREPQCSGSELDASRLARSGLCNIEGHSAPLPELIETSLLHESASAIAGQSTEVHLVLRNTGTEDAELFLDHSCGFENLSTKVVTDSRGNRLDRVGRQDCPLDAACVGQVAHFTLSAQGKATITLPLKATVTVIGDSCEELPGRALSPGRYSVAWQTPYAEKPFTTALLVTKLARLAKSRCKEYASVVAKKAEPAIAQRLHVQKELLAACLRQQPSQEFADCQMQSTTEAQLAQCSEAHHP